MKTLNFYFVLASVLCLSMNDASAFSLFGSEKKDALKKADELVVSADRAGAEKRVLDQISDLRMAMNEYRKLVAEYPDYKADHVADQMFYVERQLQETSRAVREGRVTVPDPDAVLNGGGDGFVSQNVARPASPEPDAPTFRQPSPALVQTSATNVSKDTIRDTANPNAVVAGASPRMNAGNAASALDLDQPMPSARFFNTQPSAEVQVFESTQEREAQGLALPMEDAARSAAVVKLLRTAQAPLAVSMLDDAFEREGDSFTTSSRLLLVRALLQCRNYKRASAMLKELPLGLNQNPTVLSLRTAAAIGMGEYHEAAFQLDTLIRVAPDYSDAYVNLAYVSFMMDPIANREIAISYYKYALARGSVRDSNLEKELNIRIE